MYTINVPGIKELNLTLLAGMMRITNTLELSSHYVLEFNIFAAANIVSLRILLLKA